MEIYLTPLGLLFIFLPAAILLLLKHFEVQVVQERVFRHFKKRKKSDKYTRFPFGFETEPALFMESKYDVWFFFLPIINIFFTIYIVFLVLRTKYYKKLYFADISKEIGLIL